MRPGAPPRCSAAASANDSSEASKHGAFFLVVRTEQAAAKLMTECPKCGARNSYGLELAWRLQGSEVQRVFDAD